MSDIYEFNVTDYRGKAVDLSEYKGKWLLIVNTASECGFTPQYKGLQAMYDNLKDKLEILAFPCNQFGKQEPGANEEIKQFCDLQFNISFPLMAKIDVNGDNADPLYRYLKTAQKGVLGTQAIKWNFTKFLVSPEGKVIKRYAPTDKPETIEQELKQLMA